MPRAVVEAQLVAPLVYCPVTMPWAESVLACHIVLGECVCRPCLTPQVHTTQVQLCVRPRAVVEARLVVPLVLHPVTMPWAESVLACHIVLGDCVCRSFPGSSSVRSPPAAQAEPAGGFSSPIPGSSHSPLAAPECPAVINLVSPGPDKPADWSGVDSAQAAALAPSAINFEKHSRSSSPAHSRVDTTGGSHDEAYL